MEKRFDKKELYEAIEKRDSKKIRQIYNSWNNEKKRN